MTEYSVEKFYNEYAIKQEDTIVAVIDSGTNARKVCDLLNEQDKRIKELEEENKQLKKELESFEQVSFTDLCDKSRTILYMKKENVGDLE